MLALLLWWAGLPGGVGQPGQDPDGDGWNYGLADGDLLDVPKP